MKLRILGDSLRLRLTVSETETLAIGERVAECTHFPGGEELRYSLCPGDGGVEARFSRLDDHYALNVTVPSTLLRVWSNSEETTVGGESGLASGPLRLMIEKDFDCVQPRAGEEHLDTFPNPKQC